MRIDDRDYSEDELFFDWAAEGPSTFDAVPGVMVQDETLRDGLQSPSATDPTLETKVELLHLMDELRIDSVCVGLPGAGKRQSASTETLCREIATHRLRIRPNCAARTLAVDIRPIIDLSQRTGVPIEANLFIGCSPIRQYTEGWTTDTIVERIRAAVGPTAKEGLDAMFVIEDAVRSSPGDLRLFLTAAVDAGAKRICLCDTVGTAIPEGVANLVSWVRSLLDEIGDDVGIDWHGHRDRGLALGNSLAAVKAGATRIHGTALGIGERAGNTPIEQVLINLKLLGLRNHDLEPLPRYVEAVARALEMPLPPNTPIVGRDAFRTATGVHAAAVIKAIHKGDDWLGDRVYSGVPASWIGRRQRIAVGAMSGHSNVLHYLRGHDLPHDPATVEAVFERAKHSSRVLTAEEIIAAIRGAQTTSSS